MNIEIERFGEAWANDGNDFTLMGSDEESSEWKEDITVLKFVSVISPRSCELQTYRIDRYDGSYTLNCIKF